MGDTSGTSRSDHGGSELPGRASSLAVARLSLLAAVLAGPVTAAAQGSISLGGGVSAFSLSSDLIEGGSVITYEFTFGYRFASLAGVVPINRLSPCCSKQKWPMGG